MILKVFSVFDSKAKLFSHPFYCLNSGVAVRSFEQAVNDSNGDFGRWPSDYTLFELGEFDDDTGFISCHSTPVSLGLAVEFVRSGAGPGPQGSGR